MLFITSAVLFIVLKEILMDFGSPHDTQALQYLLSIFFTLFALIANIPFQFCNGMYLWLWPIRFVLLPYTFITPTVHFHMQILLMSIPPSIRWFHPSHFPATASMNSKLLPTVIWYYFTCNLGNKNTANFAIARHGCVVKFSFCCELKLNISWWLGILNTLGVMWQCRIKRSTQK